MPDTAQSADGPAARVGMFPTPGLLSQGQERAREYLAQVGEAGIDYVCCGDHVSFFGLGFDGLVQATAMAMLHPTLPVHVGVYLLPLRHPVLGGPPARRLRRTCPRTACPRGRGGRRGST